VSVNSCYFFTILSENVHYKFDFVYITLVLHALADRKYFLSSKNRMFSIQLRLIASLYSPGDKCFFRTQPVPLNVVIKLVLLLLS
jgi:hypothetical protein